MNRKLKKKLPQLKTMNKVVMLIILIFTIIFLYSILDEQKTTVEEMTTAKEKKQGNYDFDDSMCISLIAIYF